MVQIIYRLLGTLVGSDTIMMDYDTHENYKPIIIQLSFHAQNYKKKKKNGPEDQAFQSIIFTNILKLWEVNGLIQAF